DGLVLRVRGQPGEMVGPEREEPLITMVDASEARVRAYVEEMDALGVVPGQRARVVADALPGESRRGTVLACSPSLTRKDLQRNLPGERADVKVREVVIRLDSPGNLVIGLPVDVFIDPSP